MTLIADSRYTLSSTTARRPWRPGYQMPKPPLTTAEAAWWLGLSERQVQHLAALGRIPGAQKFGERTWQFPQRLRVLPPERPPHRPRAAG